MQVISIQSQVVYGHVGNSAALLPLQANGVTVAGVPTTLLSNHPHYPTMRGRILEAELVADLLCGVEERGLVETAVVVLTGYLGSIANGEVVAQFVRRAKAANPRLLYLCDPVIGDDDLGIFVDPALPQLFRECLLPMADLITPNQFEFRLLTGVEAASACEMIVAASTLAPQTVITGCTLEDTPVSDIDTVAIKNGQAWRVTTPRLGIRPAGTGDLFSGLLAMGLARKAAFTDAVSAAVSSTFAVLQETEITDSYEMCLTPCVAKLAQPEHVFPALAIAAEPAHA